MFRLTCASSTEPTFLVLRNNGPKPNRASGTTDVFGHGRFRIYQFKENCEMKFLRFGIQNKKHLHRFNKNFLYIDRIE